ncbi:LamG domain-containing protein [Actinacidiphila alni]|uniref:LamG domain-containing protein n=1 Tax=Actinacidiphila alni TaxID=380248 RepID=UPI0034562013
MQPLVAIAGHEALADSAPTVQETSGQDLSPEAAASKQAAETGSPVEVTSETTPTERVTAQPDGTFRLDADAAPVRARQGSAWVPVNTTLQTGSDHLVHPRAAAVDVAFSGGGDAVPLATVSENGTSYGITAPWTLPAPALSGSTATYASVLPDVDLVVSAVADGFTENVVVKTRAAAQNPQLASLRFPVTAHGLTVKQLSSGGAALLDADGRPQFTTGTALQWDSAQPAQAPAAAQMSRDVVGPQVASVDATDDPAPGSKSTAMDVSIDSKAMTVTPDKEFLDDANTVYPVVLDPQTTGNHLSGWTTLWSNGSMASTSFWKTSHTLGVGYDAYVDNKISRTLYQFDTHGVTGNRVLEATFTAEEVWSANCTATKVDLWRTGSISPSTTWNKPPKWYSQVDTVPAAKGYSSSCPGGNVSFNATGAVSASAGALGDTTTLGLRADKENDPIAWKQFASPSDVTPTLSVTYVSSPSAPTGMKISNPNVGCAAASKPSVIRDATPTLAAAPRSSDGSQATLRPQFYVRDSGNNEVFKGSPSAWTASGTSGSWTTPTLSEGKVYHVAARSEYSYNWNGHSGSMYSSMSPYCYFKIDTHAPARPDVEAADGLYLECAAHDAPDECATHGGVGKAGSFLLKAGSSDVTKYVYSLNNGTDVAKSFASPTTSVTIKLAPNVRGLNVLTVRTFDAALNESEPYAYYFEVAAGSAPVDSWSFDEGTGTTAADAAGTHPATLGGTAAWANRARLGKALMTDGSASYATASGTGLDSSHSFSVSGWADLKSLTQNSVIVSQTGTNGTSFALYYSASYKAWVFNRYTSDSATPTIVRSVSTAVPVLEAWTHLLGVYDEQAQTIQLYVNGIPQGDPVAFTTPWKATGALQIGRSQIGAQFSDYANARIDEITFWNRILSDEEVADLEATEDAQGHARPVATVDWEMDSPTGSTTSDLSGYGHTGSIGTGAAWATDTDGGMGNVVSLNGSASSYLTAPGAMVDSQGDFTVAAWAKLDGASLSDTSIAHTVRIAGQSGTTRDSWGLWYSQPAGTTMGAWMFGRTTADATTATVVSAPADIASAVLTDPTSWTFLTGVYDGAHHQLQLYINGKRQGGSSDDNSYDGIEFTKAWQATGGFSVGRGRTSTGAYGDFATGLVDKVRVWTGVMSPTDIDQLSINELPVPL